MSDTENSTESVPNATTIADTITTEKKKSSIFDWLCVLLTITCIVLICIVFFYANLKKPETFRIIIIILLFVLLFFQVIGIIKRLKMDGEVVNMFKRSYAQIRKKLHSKKQKEQPKQGLFKVARSGDSK